MSSYRFVPPADANERLSDVEIASHLAAAQLASSNPSSDIAALQSLAIATGLEIAPTDQHQLRQSSSKIWRSSPDTGLLFILPVIPDEESEHVSSSSSSSSADASATASASATAYASEPPQPPASDATASSTSAASSINPTHDPMIDYLLAKGIIPQQKPENGTLLQTAVRRSAP